MNAYKLHQEFRFSVCKEEFAVTRNGESRLQVVETRKNGQEDCHMNGELELRDGVWHWADRESRLQFVQYGNDGVADAIPAYINANSIPP